MPLGFIHLIESETETGSGAIYFCGIDDAVAAINPARMSGFPRDMICPRCLQALEAQASQGQTST
jgi:hypothetical protein